MLKDPSSGIMILLRKKLEVPFHDLSELFFSHP